VPFPPTNIQLNQKNSTFVNISWTASVGTNIYYKIVLSPPTVPKTTIYAQTSIILSPLLPSTTYTIYIYAGVNNPSNGAETYETAGMKIFFLNDCMHLIDYYN